MPNSYCDFYVHYVWATWDREPFIKEQFEEQLHRVMCQEVERLNCTIVQVGGTENHVHLLVKVPATLPLYQVPKYVKGATSFWVNETIKPQHHFRWQNSYSAFSVSRWDVRRIAKYIRNQKQHHEGHTCISKLELRPETQPSE